MRDSLWAVLQRWSCSTCQELLTHQLQCIQHCEKDLGGTNPFGGRALLAFGWIQFPLSHIRQTWHQRNNDDNNRWALSRQSLTCLSIIRPCPASISEGVPESIRLLDMFRKLKSAQWGASQHKPSGILIAFLSSNYMHRFWWQPHEMKHNFYFHSKSH